MNTIPVSELRSSFAAVCRSVDLSGQQYLITHRNIPVARLLHPDLPVQTKEIGRFGVEEGRKSLNRIWESTVRTGGHVVITYHDRPRAVIVPYTAEPTLAAA